MKTPIFDFVSNYAKQNGVRLHMPGHKGNSSLGIEALDITEIKGADSLYEADGIINESEQYASQIFGSDTFYSTEGSSLCIRAMLYLVTLLASENRQRPLIFASRNAHKAFLSSVALLDLDVQWLTSERDDSYLSFTLSANELDEIIEKAERKPTAVYLTSPDYLGNVLDVKKIAEICHKHNVLLLVDNAHGAYLHFLGESKHPITLGADMCSDSAHKTLAVLTGGAYLHISKNAPSLFTEQAKNALSLFGSTSPSYLILQSLDLANKYIEEGYREKLLRFSVKAKNLCKTLKNHGYSLIGDEVLKITIQTKDYGYTGNEFADMLREKNIECEFSDPDFVVFMLTPEIDDGMLDSFEKTLLSIPRKNIITQKPPIPSLPKKAMSVRNATFSPKELLPREECLGRVLAFSEVGCPPAVPIIVSGEIIDENALKCFEYYGIQNCCVVK
ncbi:MAG: aminotransferase class V-fold PLP-dependent enzyme [Ruminococcaceae bacterium]|nr:aminotransferase class V-fold PLP-dependent enzyme [Oscillospiraceae bacterium]